jgi:YHS domain-containing protein
VIRKLLWALAVIGFWLVVRSLIRAFRTPRPEPLHAAGKPRFEGAMVRDRVCETFLPRNRALIVRDGDEEHFFCSETCRQSFLGRHRAAR